MTRTQPTPPAAADDSPESLPADGQSDDKLVQPDRVKVWLDAFQRLWVRVDEREVADVQPRKVFPLSNRSDYVSFLGEQDREVLLLAHPHRLDRASRKALHRALERMYYRAKILQVYAIREISGGVCLWNVRTDRGYANFEVVERNDRVKHFPPGRYLITDVDGNRFEIEDLHALDEHSREVVFHET